MLGDVVAAMPPVGLLPHNLSVLRVQYNLRGSQSFALPRSPTLLRCTLAATSCISSSTNCPTTRSPACSRWPGGLRATVGEPAHRRQPSLLSVRPTMAGAIPLTALMKLSPKASLSTEAL